MTFRRYCVLLLIVNVFHVILGCSPFCDWYPWEPWSNCSAGNVTRVRLRGMCCHQNRTKIICFQECNVTLGDDAETENCNLTSTTATVESSSAGMDSELSTFTISELSKTTTTKAVIGVSTVTFSLPSTKKTTDKPSLPLKETSPVRSTEGYSTSNGQGLENSSISTIVNPYPLMTIRTVVGVRTVTPSLSSTKKTTIVNPYSSTRSQRTPKGDKPSKEVITNGIAEGTSTSKGHGEISGSGMVNPYISTISQKTLSTDDEIRSVTKHLSKSLQSPNNERQSSAAVIVGSILGSVFFLAALTLLIIFLYKHKLRKVHPSDQPSSTNSTGGQKSTDEPNIVSLVV